VLEIVEKMAHDESLYENLKNVAEPIKKIEVFHFQKGLIKIDPLTK